MGRVAMDTAERLSNHMYILARSIGNPKSAGLVIAKSPVYVGCNSARNVWK